MSETTHNTIHSIYGEIKVGDTIKWSGEYYDGKNPDGSHKLKHLEGINNVIDIFIQHNDLMMKLDNNKLFSIKNVKTGEEYDNSWEKIPN